MFGLGGKKKAPPRGVPSLSPMRVPVEEVNTLSSRGFSEPEIVNALKKQGYSLPEIDQGMKGALRNAASGGSGIAPLGREQPFEENLGPIPKGNTFQPPPGMEIEHPSFKATGGGFDDLKFNRPPPTQEYVDNYQTPQIQEPPSPRDDFDTPQMRPSNDFEVPTGNQFDTSIPAPRQYKPEPVEKPLPSLDTTSYEKKVSKKQIEELVEVIIEEKWHDMKSKLNGMDTKFLETNNKIVALENLMRQMRSERADELKHIENKIDNYKGSMDDMNGKIQSMENAMRDSLTPLISTLRSLSETINNLKEKKSL